MSRIIRRNGLVGCVPIGALLAACGLAQAQSFNFEPPLYTGSAAGTIVSGQDGWYLPAVANSGDGNVFTYAGNPYGIVTNPLGGTQFEAGECNPPNFVRAQHPVNFTGGSGVWEGTIDVNGLFSAINGGVLPAGDNLGSFSFQPTPTARYYQTLMRWNPATAPALIQYPGGPALPNHATLGDFFHLAIGHATAATPTTLSFSIPSADWMSRPVNNWYRTKLKWDFASSAVLSVSIQNLTAGGAAAVTDVSARGWYLNGGLNSTAPLPTDVRLFTGSAARGNVAAWDNISFGPAAVGSGACCLSAGGCQILPQTTCVSQGGAYAGDNILCANANCPAAGACCLFDGSCVSTVQTSCTNQGGVFSPNPCGTCVAFGYSEGATDAGDLPASATSISGTGQPLTLILGTLDLDDVDMFKIKICNEASFGATTVGSGTTADTMLFVFDLTGKGIVMSDDTSATVAQFSTLTSALVTANGDYYLAISSFNNTSLVGRMPVDSLGNQLFTANNPANGFPYPEWAPTGPGAANAVAGWSGATETAGAAYKIFLTGSCFLGGAPVCYANCDGVGGLTANDFICFLTKYNNGDSYADCDGVGGLTANDFICFLTRYNNGCS